MDPNTAPLNVVCVALWPGAKTYEAAMPYLVSGKRKWRRWNTTTKVLTATTAPIAYQPLPGPSLPGQMPLQGGDGVTFWKTNT